MRSRWEGPAAAFALLASGCSAEPPEVTRVATIAQPIFDGTATDGDPGVVPILASGRIYCSGTIISPVTVLTAAHCLTLARPEAVELPGHWVVPVSKALAHPDFDSVSLANDIAVLVLETPVDPRWKTPVIRESAQSHVGATIRIAGYGKATLHDTEAQKRTGRARIDALDATHLVVGAAPSGPCGGDSGGPAFLTIGAAEVIVGVVSSGEPHCDGLSLFTRTDVFAAWIAEQVATARPHTRKTGEACVHPTSCLEGSCFSPVDAPSHPYCTKACASDDACPASMRCEESRCAYVASPGSTGAQCAADADCETRRCASAFGENVPAVCAKLCVEDVTSCSAGSCVRDARHPGQSACLPDGAEDNGGCTTSVRPASRSRDWPDAIAIVALALVCVHARKRYRRDKGART